MSLFSNLYISFFLVSIIFQNLANAARFDVTNNCPDTVWAAASPGGGRQLNHGETWPLDVPAGTTQARIWARTGCQFDASGRGRCKTGDCNGLLQCQGYGAAPNTLAEFALNQYMNMDFIDMSVIDGFNVPMEFSSTSGGCNRVIKCTADIIGQCPNELKVDGGCNGACPVFKTDEYCCNSGNCGPTNYSRFFKERCPDVYSYPKDDPTSTFTCPGGTNYKVVFCP
ncbi:protein P21-like [Punica granatum]|uniref:Protein P21-like n=2 Tax=Punica granatum TaxID=22663 RepID=A0A6P8D1E6_PUNGR|nr:protein P21-like [Punica granatum]PKI55250.1 hypothetical protein CRG98_024367 [Punica granatum]